METKTQWTILKCTLILSLVYSLLSACSSVGKSLMNANYKDNDGTEISISSEIEDLNKGTKTVQE